MTHSGTGSIGRLGIVGAGTMGAGIMINGVTSGISVTLVDRDAATLQAARAKLDRYLARQVEKGRMESKHVPEVVERLTVDTNLAALVACDLVIEAVFENLDLKQTIFSRLDRIVSADAILASNTSCLRLADIARNLKGADRFCGMHYFSPAEINPVVELIQGPETTDATLSKVERFLRATGKEVIACKDQNGFALNRFFCPYTNEAARILDDGRASTSQIDEVAKQVFGVALGPFAVMNIIGTATNLNAVRNLASLGAFYAPAGSLIEHGEKNAPWQIDDDPAPLEDGARAAITNRLIGSVLFPVQELLLEGTATLNDVDKGARLALRFSRPPGQLLSDLGSDEVARVVGMVARYG